MKVRGRVAFIILLFGAFLAAPVLAQTQGSLTGTFAVQNATPVVLQPVVYDKTETVTVTSLAPTQEYAIKVDVTDDNGWTDIAEVRVKLYPGASAGVMDTPPSTTDPAYYAEFRWTPSLGWEMVAVTGSTWQINITSSHYTNTTTTLTLWFHIIIGKNATEPDGVTYTEWEVYVIATDQGGLFDDNFTDGLTMQWYGELSLSTTSVDWGTLNLGATDALYITPDPATTPIKYTVISNGVDYAVNIWSTAQWTTAGGATANLDTDGTIAAGEFQLKANNLNDPTTATQVVATATQLGATANGPTPETGVTSDLYMWVSLATTGLLPGTYTGTIYVEVVNPTP